MLNHTNVNHRLLSFLNSVSTEFCFYEKKKNNTNQQPQVPSANTEHILYKVFIYEY